MGTQLDLDVQELKVLIRVMTKTFPSRPGLRLGKELKSELAACTAHRRGSKKP